MKRLLTALAIALLLSAGAHAALADVVISELMAKNGIWQQGHAWNWVELYNSGADTADLSGWGLSDESDAPFLFAFAQGTRLKPGAALVVHCVGDAPGSTPGKGHFAPFKLSGDGETLLLTRPDGTQAQALTFPAQFGNISWGLADGAYRYLGQASPGSPNRAQGYDSQLAAPALSPAGFFSGSAEVAMQAAPGTVIRYTLDGSQPTERAQAYQKPLRVSKTTVVRARAFMQGVLPSPDAAATYFIDDAPVSAVVSLIGDKKYLFDAKTGALVKGTGATPNYDKELEYPIHIEYFDEQGARLIAQTGSFTASGHSARVNAQKSIALYARSAYGPERFAFNPFPNRSYPSYKSLLLRSANSDAHSTRLRDPVLSSSAAGLGLLYQDARPIVVYINGEYWGHYNLREKINKYFVAQWEGVTKESEIDRIDILARTGTDDYVQNGSNEDWLALMDFCRSHDLNVPENLQYVQERLDIDNFFRHSIFEMIIGNKDMTNVRMYRVPGGKWKYLLFDVEAGFLSLDEEPISWYIKPRNAKRARFQHVHLSALLEVPQMRSRFLQLFGEMLESNFLWPDVESRFLAWESALEPLLPRHFKRWKGLNAEKWRVNVNAVKYYARVRPLKVIGLICQRMKVSPQERAQYFGQAEQRLETLNRRQP
ncbi:MAG: hypothetical protein GX653_01545 [Clostridiales bacterium]|nr:hypothetical protein [Clostridiales bacterium]